MIGEGAEDLLMKARCRLLVMQPWYGTMASLMTWSMNDEVKTMGVRMMSGGRVECLWSRRFVEAIGSVESLMSVIQHEIEHIVRMHICRHGARDPKLSNVATDCCVNGPESNPRVDGLPMIPVFDEDGNKTGEAPPYYFPEGEQDLPLDSTYEEVYEWFDKKQDKIFINMPGSGDLSSDPDKKPKKGQKIINGTTVDDHSIWEQSELSEDESRQAIKDMVEQATKKAGSAPGHLTEAIKALQDPKVNWKYLLKQFCGRALGGKRRTFARRNRRIDRFGIPGKSNHATIPLLIGVDVSGSVAGNPKLLEQFFSEIESMSHQFKITLVLWDAKVQLCEKYHRGDWKKIPAKGGAGTNVIYFFEWIKEKGLLHNVVICLTDGEVSGWPQPVDTPVLWAIAGDAKPPFGQTIYLEA
jgi:predicted metal-dependent peptidase